MNDNYEYDFSKGIDFTYRGISIIPPATVIIGDDAYAFKDRQTAQLAIDEFHDMCISKFGAQKKKARA